MAHENSWRNNQHWRVGRKVGRTIYVTPVDDPDIDGVLIGVMDTRGLAHMAAAAPDLYRATKTWQETTTDMLNMLVEAGVSEAVVQAAVDMLSPSGIAACAALKKARGE